MDENELQHLVYTAYQHRGPFAIRIAGGTAVGVTLDGALKELPLGRGSVIREGRDVVIFGLGRSASAAVGAAERLAEYGIACGVVNPVFVKPLDVDLLLEAARNSRLIVTIEENVLAGGFGSAVLEALSEAGIKTYRSTASACRTLSSSTVLRLINGANSSWTLRASPNES